MGRLVHLVGDQLGAAARLRGSPFQEAHPWQTRPLTSPAAPLRVGSLFSGYGGLDLAVEEVFSARTIWFSEINEPVARVFSHHWPDAPNLGDITTIDWNAVPAGGHPLRRVPLPRRIDRREDGRPEARHPFRPLGAHGGSDRRTATRVGRDRKRPRAALCTRDPRKPRRRRR